MEISMPAALRQGTDVSPLRGLSIGPTGWRSPARHVFLRHYVGFLARKLTATDQNNSFLCAFLPMAMESPILLDAIIAFASGNLSNFDGMYQLAALEARSRALTGLGKAIANSLEGIYEHETALASCLVLSTSEAVLGQRTGWAEHLEGAKTIILSARAHVPGGREIRGPEAFKGSPEGEWLLRNFAYHDILGSVTRGKPALISGEYLQSIGEVVDSYLGVHSQLLVYISQISALDFAPTYVLSVNNALSTSSLLDRRRQSSCRANVVSILCSNIEYNLKAWRAKTSESSLFAIAQAYKSAALIYLYQRIRKHLSDGYNGAETQQTIKSRISAEVAMALSSIRDVPLNDQVEGILLFPLFIAGGEITDIQDMNTVRKRLHLINESRGFRNVLRACEVLEEVWRSTLSGTSSSGTPWQDVLKRQGGGLLLT
ncbi:fungal-specific transcription factor domain-containing protein [Bisporella sp. PMI_857]|nr:fungal-specific transcription factor domain-containing protein [Bisporella sp. PMI_857]